MTQQDKLIFQMTSKPGEPIKPEDLALYASETESVEARMQTILEGKNAEQVHKEQKVAAALKMIPAKFTRGLKVKIEKDPNFMGAHMPGSKEIRVGWEELDDRMVDDNSPPQKRKFKMWRESLSNEFFAHTDHDLKPGQEFSVTYIAHLLAHEVGHAVWDKLDEKLKFKLFDQMKDADVRSATLARYRGWIADKQAEYQATMGRSPAMLDSRYDREKFAEMFRQYVMLGKFKGFFKVVEKVIS